MGKICPGSCSDCINPLCGRHEMGVDRFGYDWVQLHQWQPIMHAPTRPKDDAVAICQALLDMYDRENHAADCNGYQCNEKACDYKLPKSKWHFCNTHKLNCDHLLHRVKGPGHTRIECKFCGHVPAETRYPRT